jgi:hypothetical protein
LSARIGYASLVGTHRLRLAFRKSSGSGAAS